MNPEQWLSLKWNGGSTMSDRWLNQSKIIHPGKILKGSMSEIPLKQNDVDLILTTTNYRKPLEKPCISVFGLISGINEGKIKQSIIDECHKILGE